MSTTIAALLKKHGPVLSFDAGWITIIGGKRLMNCQRCGNTFGMSELSPQGYCRACAPLAAQELAGTQQPYRLTLANVRSSIEQLQKDHDALCKTVLDVREEVKTAHERIGDLRKDFLTHVNAMSNRFESHEHEIEGNGDITGKPCYSEPIVHDILEALSALTRWHVFDEKREGTNHRRTINAAIEEIERLRKHHRSPHRVDQ